MEKTQTIKSEKSDFPINLNQSQKSRNRTKKILISILLFVVLGTGFFFFHFHKSKTSSQSEPPKTEKQLVYEKLLEKTESPTLPFIKNAGQKDETVKFYAPIENGTVYINESGITYDTKKTDEKSLAIREKLIGLDRAPIQLNPEGEKPSETDINYFLGNNPEAWKNNLENYAFINFQEVYPKIEFKVRATQKNIEKLFIVDAKGNPNDIKLGFDGIDKIEVTEHGELKLTSKDQTLILTAPQAYQYKDEKKDYIAVTYELKEDNTYGFKVENYDSEKMLVIDPMISSTLIGGGEEERFEFNSSFSAYTGRPNITQDASGNVYIVGHTRSADYPTTLGVYDTSFNDADPNFGNDIVISKFNSDLTTLIASTYLGGTDEDNAFAINLDSSSNIYVSGYTKSSNFPMAGTPYQGTFQGGTYDIFIARLNNDLTSLTSSTYLGGNGEDHSITMLISGTSLYVAGDTNSANFPTTAGTIKTTKEGTVDGFISELNLNLGTLTTSTFFGGNNDDYIKDIDLYSSNLYITGYTSSTTNLASGTAYSSTYGGGTSDAFVASINTTLTTINQSTYLGGTSLDYAMALDIDATGRIIVTGSTQDSFTTTAGVYDTTHNSVGQYDGFVSILTTNLSTLTASTYIGGNGSDEMYDVIADAASNIYVSGYTASTNYPANNALQGAGDGTITKFNSTLTQLTASTLIGGTSNIDKVFGLDMTTDGKILASGITDSTNFPTTTGAYQETNLGKRDIFISKLDSDLIIAQTPHHIQLTIASSATPTIRAGVAENLVFEAKDILNENLLSYNSDHTFVLSGAVAGPNGVVATCNGINFGSSLTLTFVNGVASCSLITTKANSTQSFDADETGGTNLDTLGSVDYDLSPIVNPGVISAVQSSIDSSNENFSAGATITARITPYDMYQNPMGAMGNVDLPDVDVTITGSNPGTYNDVAFNVGWQSFTVAYTGTIAGHDLITATINSTSVGRDSDPSTTSPYDGSNGTRNLLGFDHFEVTIADSSTFSGTVGQTYVLQARMKNSLRETLTAYSDMVDMVFSGAADSPYGFKSTCVDFWGNAVEFGSVTRNSLANGLFSCNLIIKGAQSGTSIEATYSGKTSTADPAYDLDLNITPTVADHLNLREISQTPYHSDVINKDAAQTSNIVVSARDQFGNIDPTYTGNHNILFSGPTNSYGKSGVGGLVPTVNGDANAFTTATPAGTGTTLNFTSGETASTPMVLYAKGIQQIEVNDGTYDSWSSGYSGMNLNNLDLDMNISSDGTIDYTNSEISSLANPNGTCGNMELLVITRDQYGNQLEGEHSDALTISLTFDPASTNNAGVTTGPLTNMTDGSYSYSYVALPGLDKVTGTISSNPIVSDSYPSTPIAGDLGSDGTYLQEIVSGYNKRTWTGAVSIDWNTAGNWLEGTVPLYCSYVIIARSNYVGTNCAGAVCQPTINLSTGIKEVQGIYLGKSFDPFAVAPFDIETTPHAYHNVDADGDANLTLSQSSLTNYLKINDDLIIYEKGLITHPANTTARTHVVNIEVGDDFTTQASDLDISGIVDADEKGEIDVNYKGYQRSDGPGAGIDGSWGGAASGASGASYGGDGGKGITSGTISAVYGSIAQPAELGSGGGDVLSGSGYGGPGGGAVKLIVSGTSTISGLINAKGANYVATSSYGGGGSGGSIWLSTGTLAGTGTFSVNGGTGAASANGGGGGGGRIAVYYTNDTSSIAYQSYGGTSGYAFGGAGTIYKKVAANTYGDLIVDNNNQDSTDDRYIGKTPVNETIDFNSVTVQNYGALNITPTTNIAYSTLNWPNKGIILDNGGAFPPISGGGNLVIPATSRLMGNTARTFTGVTVAGTLSHSNNSTTEQYKLNYTINGDCAVNAGGIIDVNYRGYQLSEGPGAGNDGAGASGASHGGTGGTAGLAVSSVYDNVLEPNNLGSGGGSQSSSSNSGSGGGSIKLTVSGTTTFLGNVTAKGRDYVSNGAGGSGGSIWLSTGTLLGSGTISANGGAGYAGTYYSNGGGAGGRIAVYYADDSSSSNIFQAYGGSGYAVGGAGTIYKKASSATYGNLIIDNNNQDPSDSIYPGRTILNSGSTFDTVTIQNYGSLDVVPSTNVSYSTLNWSNKGVVVDSGGTFPLFNVSSDVVIPNTSRLIGNSARTFNSLTVDGKLTHYYNYTTKQYAIDYIISGDCTVNASGTIDLNYKGYQHSAGPGQGVDSGLVNGAYSGSSGASYGGNGGVGNTASPAGPTYGSTLQPTELGSGGGDVTYESRIGGSGGGLAKLSVSGTTTISGIITAKGQNSSTMGAGGSGGGFWLTTGTLAGTGGTISVSGGTGYSYSGGGGGGRVAIYYMTDNSSSLTLQAFGGTAGFNAGPGTIYLSDTSAPANNKLIIDNNGLNGAETWLGYNITETIPIDKLHFTNYAKVVVKSGATIDFSNVNNIINDFSPIGSYFYHEAGSVIFNPDTTITGFTFTENSGANFTHTNLTVGNGGVFEQANYYYGTDSPLLFNNLTIGNSGNFTHSQNTIETNPPTHTIYLKVNNLDVQSGGAINIASKGWNTNGAYSGTLNSGAGHGGIGGQSTTGTGGAAYDSGLNPSFPGSRGFAGGAGGGAARIIVDNSLTNNGDINANATNGTINTGGGSGGSLLISAKDLNGNGNIYAKGGNTTGTGGSGAGGRVAIYYENKADYSGTTPINTANYEGGTGGNQVGAIGTFYMASADHYVVTGNATQQAGTANPIAIYLKDQNNNNYIYDGVRTLTFSGASPAPDATNPTCSNNLASNINFGQVVDLNFSSGQSNSSMILYAATAPAAAEIETTDGTFSTNGDPTWDLDVTVNAAAVDMSQAILSATPNPINITNETTVTVSITLKDQYGNNVTTGTETVTADFDLSNNGSVDQNDIVLTDSDQDGIYTTTYNPSIIGTDLITAEVNAANVTQDDDGTSDGNLHVIVDVNHYTLTYNHDANGTISGTTPQTVNHGADGTAVSAVPNTGYHFVNWSDSSTDNPRTDTSVTANLTVTANFAIDTFTLTYNPGTGGTISGPSPQVVNYGADGVEVIAIPNLGWHFVSWDGGSTNPARTDTNVTGDIAVVASFAIDTFTLTYAAGANGGVTGTSPQTIDYGANGSTVTAVPNSGYHFVSWSDSSTNNPRTDTNVTGDITVTANFAIDTFTLNYNHDANGTISGTTPQTINHGADGTAVSAVPNTGYHFVDWSDSSTDNPRTDTNVTGDITVTANFAINSYTLTYSADANGTITGTTPQTVNHGAAGTAVSAVPNSNYHFVNWSDSSTDNPRTDTNVTGNLTVTANFAINAYTLTYHPGTGGTISGTSPQTVIYGGNGTEVIAIPNPGWHFVSWDGGSTNPARTDTNVTGDITVVASFAIDTYILTYNHDTNGTISGTTPQTINHGADGTAVSAVPNTGYHFVDWSDSNTDNPRTDTNITSNLTVTANFAINSYTLTYSADANGSLTGTTPQTVNHGADGTQITAVPNSGYHFVNWSDNSTENPRTDTNVTNNITVTANFSNALTLTYIAGSGGTITGTNPQNVSYGDDGTEVTATPNVGYHFTDWSDNSTDNPRTDTNIQADATYTANFTINSYTLTYSANANGSLTGTTSQTVTHGESGTQITAVPDSNYHFVNWSDSSTDNPRTDTNIQANLNVTANFSNSSALSLTYTAGPGGTITGVTPQTVTIGSDGTQVTATPSTGYHFINWSDNSTQNPRTDTNVQTDLTLTANFEKNTFTLRYRDDGNGEIDGDETQTISYDEDGKEVEAKPNTGYLFKEWSDGKDSNPRKDKNIQADLSVTAEFEKEEYTLKYLANSNGSIQGDANQTVKYKEDGEEVEALPATNYHFTNWSDGKTERVRTDTDIKADLTLTANFASDLETPTETTYNLTYTSGGNGTLSGNANQTVKTGESGTPITAIPDNNYHFTDWSDGNAQNPRTDTNITKNIFAVANFALDNTDPIIAGPIDTPKDNPEDTSKPEEKTEQVATTKTPETKKTVTKNSSEKKTSLANIEAKEERIFPNVLPAIPPQQEAQAQAATVVALSTTLLPLFYQTGSAKSLMLLLRDLPFGFLGLLSKTKKRKNWGMVYDSATGDPIPLVSISVIEAATGKTKETKLTDKFGSYYFLVPKGEYQLEIKKSGYVIDSHDIDAKTYYTNVLTDPEKKKLTFTDSGIICYDLCLKATNPNQKSFKDKRLSYFFFAAIFYLGLLLTLFVTLSNPTNLNLFILLVYVSNVIIRNMTHLGSRWGYVVNKEGTKQPFSAISLLDRNTKQLIARTISDEQGRYILLANPGDYILKTIANASQFSQKEENLTLRERGMVKRKIVV
ncbi:MAG: InlB B-repeat-containing protein [Candidatus Moraniibacteriota bacterium]